MKTLYNDYFQKSRIFLYPVLEIKRGGSITPIQTYVSWDNIKHHDYKLITVYHIREDKEYKQFEKTKLLGNKLFEQFIEGEGNKGIYIFDLSHLKDSWSNFLLGKYSKLSMLHKNYIKAFYKGSSNYSYIDSYLHPDKYYSLYSDLLGVSIKTLKEVGELTDPIDIDKEILEFEMKAITFNKQVTKL